MNAAMGTNVCTICRSGLPVPATRLFDDAVLVQCPMCGDYQITEEAYLLLVNPAGALEKRYLLSGRSKTAAALWGGPYRFEATVVQDMKEGRLRDKPVSEKLELGMRWFERAAPGVMMAVNAANNYTAAYCANLQEFEYLLFQLEGMGLLNLIRGHSIGSALVTAKGWLWLEERTKGGTGAQAFIAMSFSSAMKGTEAALKAGVLAAGYEPFLVKDREFSDGIVDKIYAEIRKSRFVVADFTENKAGVYLEAGFARGLGLNVIGTCEVSHLDPKSPNHLHFDVRGLNMIDWTPNNLSALTERLTQRISGMYGQGPVKP